MSITPDKIVILADLLFRLVDKILAWLKPGKAQPRKRVAEDWPDVLSTGARKAADRAAERKFK